jgi:hypothetical protein
MAAADRASQVNLARRFIGSDKKASARESIGVRSQK